jgi:hypothetical protein
MAWAVLVTLFFNSGCTSAQASGSLRTVSLGDNAVVFPTDFKSVFYSHDPESGTTSFMLAGYSHQSVTSSVAVGLSAWIRSGSSWSAAARPAPILGIRDLARPLLTIRDLVNGFAAVIV